MERDDRMLSQVPALIAAAGLVIGLSLPAPSVLAQGQPLAGSVLEGVFTAAQADRGESTWREACASCHETTEFSGARFRLSWVGRTAGDLFDTISTLMPEGNPGSLSPDEYASVVAYLFRLNGYTAGEIELPEDFRAASFFEVQERA